VCVFGSVRLRTQMRWGVAWQRCGDARHLWCCLATLWFYTAWRLGQAHAVLDRNHARGEGCGVRLPGDARLSFQSPVARPSHHALPYVEIPKM